MYKKITKGHQTVFTPRRMVIGGVVHNVENEETLNKIKKEMAAKKEEQAKIAEEIKNQKILVKRTVSKNMNDVVTKTLIDPDSILSREEKLHQEKKNNKYIEHTKKPGLVVKSNAPTSNNDTKISGNSGPITVKTHAQKFIKKPSDRNIIPVNNNGDNDNQKEINNTIMGGIARDNDSDDVKEENAKQLTIKTNERKLVVKSMNKPTNKLINNQPKEVQEDTADNYFTKKYPVLNEQWYELIIKIKQFTNNHAVKLLIKIVDENKNAIIHPIKISNDLFLHEKYPNNFIDYKIYAYIPINVSMVDVYIVGLKVYNINLSPIDKHIVEQNIDLWKFRKLNDLDCINYYTKNAELEYSEKFIDRFKGEYNLYKNPNHFEQFINSLNISKTSNIVPKQNSKNKILYLVHSSIEYEEYSYTLRTQQLLETFNNNNSNYKIICATRYGYPFDREVGYYTKDPIKETKYNGVKYIKFIDEKSSNFNTLNILKYLERNIIEVINLCIKKNIKIIHATTNYWNGIVAINVAKYLNIKCIYEFRELWSENIMVQKPEVMHSDISKMLAIQEKNIVTNVDKIIVLNNTQNKYDPGKTEILYDGAKIIINENDDIKNALLTKHKLHNKTIIGYIGSLVSHQGIETLLKCIKTLDDDKIMLVIIGDGIYKNAMNDYIKTNDISNNVLYLGKLKYNDTMEYYQIFDMCVYPKKKCELYELKSSFKIIESLAHGVPIITTDSKANREIIIDGENGLLYDNDNFNDLLNKIKLLLSDSDMKTSLKVNGIEWVKKNRNLDSIANKLMEIYGNLIENNIENNEDINENTIMSDVENDNNYDIDNE